MRLSLCYNFLHSSVGVSLVNASLELIPCKTRAEPVAAVHDSDVVISPPL